MNSAILLDTLIVQSSGNTLYFSHETCPLSIVKEAILRGFQVLHIGKIDHKDETVGGSSFGSGDGSGMSSGYGEVWNPAACMWIRESGYLIFGGGYTKFNTGTADFCGSGISPGDGIIPMYGTENFQKDYLRFFGNREIRKAEYSFAGPPYFLYF